MKHELQAAILGLEFLLESQDTTESNYQQFLENNPIVFRTLGFARSVSFTKESGRSLPRDDTTGLKPEPDFLVEKPDNLWEIFEIKTPILKDLTITSNKYRERFTAEAINYISQTITYEKYFTRNPKNRAKVKNLYDIDIQEDLDIKILIGLSKYIDKTKVHQKCREFTHKIDIITYDEILRRLEDEYNSIYGIFENLPGISFHGVVRFRESKELGPKYFLDIGKNVDRDRLSLFISERSDIACVLHDHEGRVYNLDIPTDNIMNEWIYLVCEFGYTGDRFIMNASVNGKEYDLRQKDQAVSIGIEFDSLFLGTDISSEKFGVFDLAERFIYERKLTFKEQNGLLNYIASKYRNLNAVYRYMSFSGNQFMVRNRDGNLVQSDEARKPIYRDELETKSNT